MKKTSCRFEADRSGEWRIEAPRLLAVIIASALFLAGLAPPAPAGAQDRRGLEVAAVDLGGEQARIGRQIAVLLAVDRYEEWIPLKNAVKDARELRSILEGRYFIDEFEELYDERATKASILRLFERLVTAAKPEDSIFIYYAGHGQLDPVSETGFWIPVDAGTDRYEQKNWINNSQIRNFIGKMKARHIALVSDSCFSGDILNPNRAAAPEIDDEYFKRAYARIARQVLTSGSSEAVPDDSAFSRQLMLALEGNRRPYLDPLMLYSEVRLGVRGTTPLFGSLKDSGHQEGGSFLFFLKAEATSWAPGAIGGLEFAVEPRGASWSCPGLGSGAGIAEGSLDEVAAGSYEIVLSSAGYREAKKMIVVSAGATARLSARLGLLSPGSLEIRNPPYGAEIQLGRDSDAHRLRIGTTPESAGIAPDAIRFAPVPAGIILPISVESRATLSASEIPFPEWLTLGEGEHRVLDFPSGFISVPSVPEGTVLALVPRSPTENRIVLPLSEKGSGMVSPPLAPGLYSLAVMGPYPAAFEFRVESGKTLELPGYRAALASAIGSARDRAKERLAARRGRTGAAWLSFGLGSAGAAGSAAAYVLGRRAFAEYRDAEATVDAKAARKRIELWGTILPIAGILGGTGLGLAPFLWSGPKSSSLEEAVRKLDEELEKL